MLLVYIMFVYFVFLPLSFALFLITQMHFFFMICLWVIDTQFVCFNLYLVSCKVLLISLFSLLYVQTVFVYERAMCSLE